MIARRVLVAACGALLCVGIAASLRVLSASLSPTPKSDADRPSFDMDAVAVGRMREYRGTLFAGSVFVARTGESDFVVFSAHHQSEHRYYSRQSPDIECGRFGFDGARISCEGEVGYGGVSWDRDGAPSAPWAPKLDLIGYEVRSGRVYLNG